MSEEIYEQSDCLDRSVNSLNNMYALSEHSDQQLEASNDVDKESDQDSEAVSVVSGPTSQYCEIDQQLDNVQIVWVQEFYHYQVDRTSEDGEPFNDDDDDDDNYPHRTVESSPVLYEDRDSQLWT